MIEWLWRDFADLTNDELYEALSLREEVFTIGQKCTEPDMDGCDLQALHLLGYSEGRLAAYLRAYEKEDAIKLGRIVVAPQSQRSGVGREMMGEALIHLANKYPGRPLVMSAQKYLEAFYASLGFVSEGEPYDEAGIEHIFMRLE